jgi:hypothetical protein
VCLLGTLPSQPTGRGATLPVGFSIDTGVRVVGNIGANVSASAFLVTLVGLTQVIIPERVYGCQQGKPNVVLVITDDDAYSHPFF